MKKIGFAIALLASGIVASGAQATVLDFKYTTAIGTSISAAFQITIADTTNPVGGYTIQSVSGIVDGAAVSLTPYTQNWPFSTVGDYVFNDTVFKVGSNYFLSVSGMLVQTASAYYNFGEGGFADYAIRSTTTTSTARRSVGTYTLTVAAAATPTPEPATWAMMVGGFGLVGGALRRRRMRVAFG